MCRQNAREHAPFKPMSPDFDSLYWSKEVFGPLLLFRSYDFARSSGNGTRRLGRDNPSSTDLNDSISRKPGR